MTKNKLKSNHYELKVIHTFKQIMKTYSLLLDPLHSYQNPVQYI